MHMNGFDATYQKSLKNEFYFADYDRSGTERLFFDNSGGSLRLKAAVEAKAEAEMLFRTARKGLTHRHRN